MASTTGTKMAEMRSASAWIGALLPCACATARTMAANCVAWPTLVARTFSMPPAFWVPAYTVSPSPRATGRLSPLSALSSSTALPASTVPSTASRSPWRSTTTSPGSSLPMATSCSWPSRSTLAVLGDSASSASIAPAVRRLARLSSSLPSSTSVITDTLASKYTCWLWSAANVTHADSNHATLVPSATSTSMLAAPLRSAW